MPCEGVSESLVLIDVEQISFAKSLRQVFKNHGESCLWLH